jgi:hypothetical protein
LLLVLQIGKRKVAGGLWPVAAESPRRLKFMSTDYNPSPLRGEGQG